MCYAYTSIFETIMRFSYHAQYKVQQKWIAKHICLWAYEYNVRRLSCL